MFQGERPIILSSPETTTYKSEFTIETPNVEQIIYDPTLPPLRRRGTVVLLHPGAITHHTDPNQRYIRLKVLENESSSDHLKIVSPENGNVAPPGYYLLFIVNRELIPSVGKFIKITKI
jgi:hypothetical protein